MRAVITTLLMFTAFAPMAAVQAQGIHGSPGCEGPEIERARTIFPGTLESEGRISEAEQAFEAALEEPQCTPVARMYLATLKALRGRHSFWPLRRWNLAYEALQEMDAIVEAYPQHYEVRFLRASTTSSLPSFFEREAQAERDLQWLAEHFPQAQGQMAQNQIEAVRELLERTGYA